MRLIAVLVLAAACGCTVPSLNDTNNAPHSCSEQPKCCGCAGMQHCGKNADGTTCCKPDDCKCNMITSR
jgi:hypothetical protein